MQWSVTLSNQFYRYEAFPHAAKDCDRLAVCKRFFSAAGRTVTSDRCSLSEETVEDLVKIRLNLAKLAEEERVCGLGGGAGHAADQTRMQKRRSSWRIVQSRRVMNLMIFLCRDFTETLCQIKLYHILHYTVCPHHDWD